MIHSDNNNNILLLNHLLNIVQDIHNNATSNSTSPTDSHTNQIAAVITITLSSILWASTVLITLGCFIFIIVKRNHPIFKARSTFLILYELFITLSICILLCSRNIFDRSGFSYPCLLSIVVIVFTPNSICTPLLFSSWRLIFAHMVVGSKAKISEKKTAQDVQRVLTGYKICKFLVSTYASVLFCAVPFFIHAVISAVLAMIFRVNPSVPCSAVTDGLPMTATAVVIAVGYIILLVISGLFLLRKEDVFGIRLDLFISSAILVVAFIPVLPITFLQKQSDMVPGFILFVVSLNVKMIVSMFIIPLSKIVAWDKQSKSNATKLSSEHSQRNTITSCKSKVGYELEDLERFVNDIDVTTAETTAKHQEAVLMRTAFMNYCKTEWSVENLHAWEAISEYKKYFLVHEKSNPGTPPASGTPSNPGTSSYPGTPVELLETANNESSDIKTCATNIRDTYLVSGCALEVNVSAESRDRALNRIKEEDFKKTLFEEVEGEILLTMSDTWKRFIKNNRYKDTMKILKGKAEIMNQVGNQKI